ncbi:MAG: OsmC family protein [Candidatus Zixiibacteriota bacterium]
MTTRISSAEWKGTLKEGAGTLKLGSGVYQGPYTYASRFETGPGTNPEELLGAAHAACFSMFLSALLTTAGFTPRRIYTTATVHLDAGPTITLIELATEADVPNLSEEAFKGYVQAAKKDCPVSKALTGPEIKMTVELIK